MTNRDKSVGLNKESCCFNYVDSEHKANRRSEIFPFTSSRWIRPGGGGDSVVKNTEGCLDSLGPRILVGERYFGVLQKYRFGQ